MGFYKLLRQASRWPSGWLYRLLLPLLSAPLVVGIGMLLYFSAIDSEFRFDLTPLEVLSVEQGPSTEQIVQAIEIRFVWITAQLVLGTAMVIAIAVAIVSMLRTFVGVLLFIVGSIGSAAAGGAFFIARSENELVIMPFASELFGVV